MNKKEFFEKITEECDNRIGKTIAILRARGFFIDEIDNKYYISDNATYHDYEYLSYGLEEYGLGKISKPDYRMSESRIKHKVIVPKTGEISINSDADVGSVISFFEEKERIGVESIFTNEKWNKYLREWHAPKTDVKILESYVAYFVKAISACGITTDYSCDGNHESGGKIKMSCQYPSSIYFGIICNCYLDKIMSDINMIDVGGISFSENNKFDKYYELYQCANFLYSNRGNLIDIKYKVSDQLLEARVKQKSCEDIKIIEKKFAELIEEQIKKE